jgi:hypothetical protein
MGFEPREVSKVEAVNDFVTRTKGALEEVHAALTKAKDNMAQYYNCRQTPTPRYNIGNCIFVDASDLRISRPSQKPAHCFLGPYEIVKVIGPHAYKLKLPHTLNHVHPVFNVVKLKVAPEDPIVGRRTQPPSEPEMVDGEEEYEVEAVKDSRLRYGKLEFLIAWKGYGRETWRGGRSCPRAGVSILPGKSRRTLADTSSTTRAHKDACT